MDNDPRLRRPTNPKGFPKSWLIKKSEAKAILAEGQWTLDPEHTGAGGGGFVSERGELLLFNLHGRSVLYESRQALEEYHASKAHLPWSQHVLEGMLPQGPRSLKRCPNWSMNWPNN